MDNLTHSLIGAVLGQAGLKRKSGLAMPGLIIGANLPDVDAPWAFHPEGLAIRRGITHGPIALVLLPLVLAGCLLAFDRWQARQGRRPSDRLPVHPGWLLALCYIGTLTHPAFDWLNNYGIRLLEPFSHRWFYGDALFIVDPWLLAMLIGGIWLSRRRERVAALRWQRPARVAISMVVTYVAFNIGLSRILSELARGDAPYPQIAVANAVPLAFWQREMLLRTADGRYASVQCTLLDCERPPLDLSSAGMADPTIAARTARDPVANAFLFWSRLPVAEKRDGAIVLRDQRFMDRRTAGQFSVTLGPPPK